MSVIGTILRSGTILRWIGALILIFVSWALYRAFETPPPGPMGEVIDEEESVLTSRIVANGLSLVNANQTNGVIHRDGHPKSQGCALAQFTVLPLAWPYSQGIFKNANSAYKAWVRFSSGDPAIQSDWKPDARGMAVKVLGVDGKKLAEGEENERTQDFLMINNPVFFIKNVQEYAEFTLSQSNGSQFGYFFPGWIDSWRWRELRIATALLKFPSNLLANNFYSMTPYTLGVQNYVKYKAQPVACAAGESVPGSMAASFSPDTLRRQLTAELNSHRACFNLMIQPQVSGKNMPVEDATVEWREKDSPFIPVARIEIPKQNIDPYLQSGFCENLSFSPWHALPEHRPVGGLNRIRKAVYIAISHYRHCSNQAPTGEPDDDGSPRFENATCAPHDPFPGTAKTAAK